MNKKVQIFTLLLMLPVLWSYGQQTYQVHFSSGKYRPAELQTQLKSGKDKAERISRHQYQLIQFYQLPDAKERKQLQAAGITLQEYIPKNTYTAVIDTQKMQNNKDTDFSNVRACFLFPSEYKLDSRLTNDRMPPWASPSLGMVKVKALLFEGFSPEKAQKLATSEHTELLNYNKKQRTAKLKLPVQELQTIAKHLFVKWIQPIDPPLETKNYSTARGNRTNVLTLNYPGARNLTGEGVTIGEWDGGKVDMHQDLQGNVTNHTTAQEHFHATHVAGTILGRGLLDPMAKGMATEAQIYASDFMKGNALVVQEMEEAATNYGVDITSNSWGFNTSQYMCDHPVPYIEAASYYDQLAWQHKKLTHVFANGNDQQVCPGGFWTSSWTMKNAILVGAVDDTSAMSNFSSFGPLYDGRIVPHISGVGVGVYSTFLDDMYYTLDGTSMTTPAVSGAIALLAQKYDQLQNTHPTSAFIRAVLFNSAEDQGNPYPDYKFGYGRVNLRKAVTTIEEERYYQGEITHQDTQIVSINVPANARKLKVTLSWTDKAGTPYAATALVNDLDMRILKEGEEWLPWTLDKNNPDAIATRGKDHKTNHEQIAVVNPAEGSYTIEIAGNAIPYGPQPFSIAYQTDVPQITVTSPAGGEKLNPGTKHYIHWDAADTTGTFSISLSEDNGETWQQIASDIPGTKRHYAFEVPLTYTSEARIRVSRGSYSDISDTTFAIMQVPRNFHAVTDYQALTLKWDSVPGATNYTVFQIAEGTLDTLGTTENTSYPISGLETGKTYMLSVQAKGAEAGLKSRRAKAIKPQPVPRYDIAAGDILQPVSGINLSAQEEVKAAFINKGANALPAGDTLPLSYSINNGTPVNEQVILEDTFARGDTITYTFSETTYMATYEDYTIRVMSQYPTDTFYTENDASEIQVTNSEPVTNFPYTEDFDDFYKLMISNAFDPVYLQEGWNNNHIDDAIEWWPNSGSTYQEGTGPHEDHTGEGGKYLYTEAYILNGKPGDAFLLSPGFEVNTLDNPTLYFWYHMYARDSVMGSLHVDIKSISGDTLYKDVVPELSGSQGDQWHRRIVDLSPYKDEGIIRIRFRAKITDHAQNAFALDDVRVDELYQNDMGILSMLPVTRSAFTDDEPVQVNLINVSPDTMQAGHSFSAGYAYQGDTATENLTLSQPLPRFDTLQYTFDQTADLSDLTKRYTFKSWVKNPGDARDANDTLRNHYVQSYCEPRSNCLSGGTPTGIGTFILKGIHPQFSIENRQSLCGSTDAKGYSFHGDQKATLYRGQHYPMQLRCIIPPPDYDIPIYGEYFKIWIDFDQSGNFEADEMVFSNDRRDIDLLTDSIYIPEDAIPGNTRLRIRSSYYEKELISPTQSCTPISHGETEDYSVRILPYPQIDISALEFRNLPVTHPGLTGAENIGLLLRNKGSSTIAEGDSIPLGFQVNSNPVRRDTFIPSTPLHHLDSAVFTFSRQVDMSATGAYRIRLWSERPGDEDPFNDTLYTRIHHVQEYSGQDYQAGFETEAKGWFDESRNRLPLWERGTPQQQQIDTAWQGNNCWMTQLSRNYPNRKEMRLYSPAFNFSGMDKPLLSFRMKFVTEAAWDGMILEGSTDGENWQKLGANTQSFYNSDTTHYPAYSIRPPWWSGTNNKWKLYQLTLEQFADKPLVMLRFRMRSDKYVNKEGTAVDAVSLNQALTDIGIAAYQKPKNYENLSDRQYLTFSFANLGSKAIPASNPIAIETHVNDKTKSFTYELLNTFLPGDTLSYTTPSSFDMSGNEDYTIQVTISYEGDENAANDSVTVTLENPASGISRKNRYLLQVYPNPAKECFHIKIPEAGKSHLTIFNAMGAKVFTREVHKTTGATVTLQTNRFDTGVYMIRLSTTQHSYTKRIMLK